MTTTTKSTTATNNFLALLFDQTFFDHLLNFWVFVCRSKVYQLLSFYFPSRYCDAPGLPTPRDLCDAGYVCYGGAYTSTPTDGVTGEVCPRGGFCIIGSFESKACPPGTYSVTGGATNNQDCEKCNEGYYCATASSPRPDGPCSAGFYCGIGAITPNETITKPGYFTPEGASEPQPCAPGFYQDLQKQDRCKQCKPGFYCPRNKMSTTEPCPAGFYCPIGSHRTYECPPGTFNNYTRRSSLNDSCKACPRGYYCQGAANKLPTGEVLNGQNVV